MHHRVASAVYFPVSDQGRFVNGQVLDIAGDVRDEALNPSAWLLRLRARGHGARVGPCNNRQAIALPHGE